MAAPGETRRQPLELTHAFQMCVRDLARFHSRYPPACLIALKPMHALALTLPEQTWNASKMTRRLDAAERVSAGRPSAVALGTALRVILPAEPMIAEGLDNPAFADGATRAGNDHAREFLFKRAELLDALAHRFQVSRCDPISVAAGPLWVVGKVKQRANVWKFETKRARVAHERQPADIAIGIEPAPALGARRRSDQAFLLIKADGWNLEAGFLGDFADAQHWGLIL